MKKSQNFEQAMKRLEEIGQSLESGDIELEKSLKLYEEGIQLIEFCQKKLSDAEKTVQKLSKQDDGTFKEEPLDDLPTKDEE